MRCTPSSATQFSQGCGSGLAAKEHAQAGVLSRWGPLGREPLQFKSPKEQRLKGFRRGSRQAPCQDPFALCTTKESSRWFFCTQDFFRISMPSRERPGSARVRSTLKARGNPPVRGSVALQREPLARPERSLTSKRGNPPGPKYLTGRERSHLGVGSTLGCLRRKHWFFCRELRTQSSQFRRPRKKIEPRFNPGLTQVLDVLFSPSRALLLSCRIDKTFC